MRTNLIGAPLAASLLCVAGAAAEDDWIELLAFGNLAAWREPTGEWRTVATAAPSADDERRLTATPGSGAIVNGDAGRTSDLLTRREFGDVELHVEFLVPKGSNSGVYLMGRYEIQVLDSFGIERSDYPGNECGGIYPRWIDGQNVGGRSPRVNASRPAGEWQTFDIVFRAPRFDGQGRKTAPARFVKVLHNGVLVHEDAEVTGPTRAARFEDEAEEAPLGPLQLQGDHGPVAYRNLRIRPLRLDAISEAWPPEKRPTDMDEIAAYDSFIANSGTYEISESTLTANPIVAKDPNFMTHGSATYEYQIDGDTLQLTATDDEGGTTRMTLRRLE